MRDVKAHAIARVPRKVNGDHLTVAHGKHIVFGQRLRGCARHVGIVTIGPGGEEVARLEGRLAVSVNVNRDITERCRNVGRPAGNGEAPRGEQDAVQLVLTQLPRDALYLQGLVPRSARVDEHVAQRARHQHHVAVVMDAWQPHDLHGVATSRPVLNIPKPGGCG